jgi:AcrR family transcriptional regulator
MSPHGKEEVTRALLDAAAELFATRGVAAVSVRDIAARANVNHGLVHRHFGSKARLRHAVMEDLTRRMADEVDALQAPTTDALGSAAMDRYFRMLARALLDGEDIRDVQRSFPVVQQFLRYIEREQANGTVRSDVDARILAALGVTAGLGWLLFGPFVMAALGLRGKRVPSKLLAAWETLAQN